MWFDLWAKGSKDDERKIPVLSNGKLEANIKCEKKKRCVMFDERSLEEQESIRNEKKKIQHSKKERRSKQAAQYNLDLFCI